MALRRRAARPRLGSAEITRTTALFPNAVFVQWDINTDESGKNLVDIFRAGGPEGPWEPLADSMPDAYQYLDNKFNLPPPTGSSEVREGFNQLSLSKDVWYMVTVTPPSGPANAFSSPPTVVEPGLDRRTRLFKRKILRDESTAFRNLNGIKLVVLKRKHWGTRCDECWDPLTKEGTKEHCRKCYGTTFEGGYWAPINIRGRRTPAPVQTQMTAHGESDVRHVTFIVLDYPAIRTKDLIIDVRRNQRFLVQSVSPTELKTVFVHQNIAASEIARDAVEYEVPVDPSTTPPLY